MAFEFIKQKLQITDVSFANIFLKKLVIRLIILFFVSIIVINVAQIAMIEQHEEQIQHKLSDLTINLIQLEDKNFDNDTNIDISNKMLSQTYEDIVSSQFVSDASLSFYDLTTRKLISKSSKIFLIDSQETLDWWRQKTGNENGIPLISLSDEMKEFCYKHEDYNIYIKNMTCVNSVLFPSLITANDRKGREVASCSASVPSINENEELLVPTKLISIGNDSDDIVLKKMSDITFVKSEDENEAATVNYNESLFKANIDLVSREFEINDSNYTIDCGYNISFWYGAWNYILMFELVALLWCALSAFLNTKESFLIYK